VCCGPTTSPGQGSPPSTDGNRSAMNDKTSTAAEAADHRGSPNCSSTTGDAAAWAVPDRRPEDPPRAAPESKKSSRRSLHTHQGARTHRPRGRHKDARRAQVRLHRSARGAAARLPMPERRLRSSARSRGSSRSRSGRKAPIAAAGQKVKSDRRAREEVKKKSQAGDRGRRLPATSVISTFVVKDEQGGEHRSDTLFVDRRPSSLGLGRPATPQGLRLSAVCQNRHECVPGYTSISPLRRPSVTARPIGD